MLLVYWYDSGDILVVLKRTQSRYGHMPALAYSDIPDGDTRCQVGMTGELNSLVHY